MSEKCLTKIRTRRNTIALNNLTSILKQELHGSDSFKKIGENKEINSTLPEGLSSKLDLATVQEFNILQDNFSESQNDLIQHKGIAVCTIEQEGFLQNFFIKCIYF